MCCCQADDTISAVARSGWVVLGDYLDIGFVDDDTLVSASDKMFLAWWHVDALSGKEPSLSRLWSRGCVKLGGGSHLAVADAMAFSPDSKIVAACLGDGVVHLSRTRDGARLASLGSGHLDALNRQIHRPLVFSRDGQQLAVALADGAMLVFSKLESSPGSPELTRVPSVGRGLVGHMTCMAFSPDGCMVVTGHPQRTIVAYSLPNRTAEVLRGVGAPSHGFAPSCLAFRPDGRLLACGSFWGTVSLWGVTGGRKRNLPPLGESVRPNVTMRW